jgi:hypothetical protein
MDRFTQKARQSKEITDAYMDKYGSENRQALGKVINEQMRVAIFDLMCDFDEIREDPAVKSAEAADMLYKISRGLKELEHAEKLNAERTDNIRKAAFAEAAKIVEKEGPKAGVDDAALEIIRRKLIGLST